jgi:hypothetical protein
MIGTSEIWFLACDFSHLFKRWNVNRNTTGRDVNFCNENYTCQDGARSTLGTLGHQSKKKKQASRVYFFWFTAWIHHQPSARGWESARFRCGRDYQARLTRTLSIMSPLSPWRAQYAFCITCQSLIRRYSLVMACVHFIRNRRLMNYES